MAKFQKGQSGNPKGRPPGCQNKLTRKCQALLSEHGEAIMKTAIDQALGGDTHALRLLVPRIAPSPRTPPTPFTLPKDITSLSGLSAATDQIIKSVADGTLTCENARDIVLLLSAKRQIIEVADIENRLQRLENLIHAGTQRS